MSATLRLEDMNRSTRHELTPTECTEDRARLGFVMHLKRGLGALGQTRLKALVSARSDEDLPSQSETADILGQSTAFAAWSSLNRGSQRRMWMALADMVDRQLPALESQAARLDGREKRGSLRLVPDVELPGYLLETAFHGQPGGYVDTRDERDIRAGLLQEAGGTVYMRGAGTGRKDSKAQAVVRYLDANFPDLRPRRVLDLGCGFGGQTCGYALAYPDAETYGIDLGEAQLRYGHLRAESLGIALHLRQADACAPGFPDGHFDLIISNILLHEVPTASMREIMRQCHRLLAPGGVVIHQDVPTQVDAMPGFARHMALWQTAHNDEPFWTEFAESSVTDALAEAGFNSDAVFEAYVPQVDGPLTWYFVGARH